MEFKEELEVALNARGLENAEIQLDTNGAGKVGGYILSETFSGKSQLERQDMVWDFLGERLTKQKQLKIVSLLTLTPAEADIPA